MPMSQVKWPPEYLEWVKACQGSIPGNYFLIVWGFERYWDSTTSSRVYENDGVCGKVLGHDCVLQTKYLYTRRMVEYRPTILSIRRKIRFKLVLQRFSVSTRRLWKCWFAKETIKRGSCWKRKLYLRSRKHVLVVSWSQVYMFDYLVSW